MDKAIILSVAQNDQFYGGMLQEQLARIQKGDPMNWSEALAKEARFLRAKVPYDDHFRYPQGV